MPNVWRLRMNSQRRGIDHAAARNYAIEAGVIGAGWALTNDHLEPSPIPDQCGDIREYLKCVRQVYPDDNSVVGAAHAFGLEMEIGDYVWMYATHIGEYWCAHITGEFRYRNTEEAHRFDLHLTRQCTWVRAGVADAIPGVIRRAFSGQFGAVGRIVSGVATAIEAAEILHHAVEPAANGDFFELASPEDLEDVVALYLQELGWRLFPTTAKASMACYEFLGVHRDTHKRCGVQVKSGNVRFLDLQIAEDLTIFFVMMAHPQAQVVPHPQVSVIPRENIELFARKNWHLLPRRLQRRWQIKD
jgi:hypothetical protein